VPRYFVVFFVYFSALIGVWLSGWYQCNWLPGKTHLKSDLSCVLWDVKLYSLILHACRHFTLQAKLCTLECHGVMQCAVLKFSSLRSGTKCWSEKFIHNFTHWFHFHFILTIKQSVVICHSSVFAALDQCRINYGSGGSPELEPLNSGAS